MVQMRTDRLTSVTQRWNTNWYDFNIYNPDLYYNEIFINDLSLTDDAKNIILNFERYTGYDKKAYGVDVNIERGITEQESYEYWLDALQKKNATYKNQLKSLGISNLPQCVYDGLFLYYWFSEKLLEVEALEGVYEMRDFIVKKDWDTVASMIARCYPIKEKAIEATKILRLAFYKRYKDRRWLRQQGVFKMRDRNELFKFGVFTEEELRRARFAYYAETKKFLPNTPEGIKRDINNRYAETLSTNIFTWDGSTLDYEISKAPSLYPIEKLQVFVNNNLIQHLYDYTIDGNIVTLRNTQNYPDKSQLKFVVSI